MDRVLEYLRSHQDRFVEELCEYIAIPSVSAQSAHAGDMERAAGWVAGHCRRIGLEAAVERTPGNPVVVARTPGAGEGDRPVYLVYGHYDVQPPDPLDKWISPPFEPRIENGSLYGRGANDNKGQHFAHLKAVEAYLRTGTPLPCGIVFLLEGEEEVGSGHMAGFLRERREDLRAEGVVISDNGMPGLDHPALTYGLRGVAACEVLLTGPDRDLHSGIYGGAVDNPAMVLCQMLGALRAADGSIDVPGFHDGILPLEEEERRSLARFPMSGDGLRRSVGAPALFGEEGYTCYERVSVRPTLEINGLTSGYQGEGTKTIVPSWARAKLTCRLVPEQDPARTLEAVRRRLESLRPPTVSMEFEPGHSGEAYLADYRGPRSRAALRALERAFGRKPVLMREGGSIPIVNDFKRSLGLDTLLLGLGLPDDNTHSPNEKISLEAFRRGTAMSAWLWQELAGTG